MIRTIYMIEKIDANGNLIARRFARNLKTAGRIQRQLDPNITRIYKVRKSDWTFINPEWVEG